MLTPVLVLFFLEVPALLLELELIPPYTLPGHRGPLGLEGVEADTSPGPVQVLLRNVGGPVERCVRDAGVAGAECRPAPPAVHSESR